MWWEFIILEKGGLNMTFEKRDIVNELSAPRSGCGSCGCSGEAGRTANQAEFGRQQAAQRNNKGC